MEYVMCFWRCLSEHGAVLVKLECIITIIIALLSHFSCSFGNKLRETKFTSGLNRDSSPPQLQYFKTEWTLSERSTGAKQRQRDGDKMCHSQETMTEKDMRCSCPTLGALYCQPSNATLTNDTRRCRSEQEKHGGRKEETKEEPDESDKRRIKTDKVEPKVTNYRSTWPGHKSQLKTQLYVNSPNNSTQEDDSNLLGEPQTARPQHICQQH